MINAFSKKNVKTLYAFQNLLKYTVVSKHSLGSTIAFYTA